MESGKRKSKKDPKASGQNISFQFNAPVSADQQTFVNGDVDNLNINQGLSKDDLARLNSLFQPFKEQVQQAAPPDKQNQVEEKVQELHTELSKGQSANTDRLNKIVDGLVELVPGALSAVVSMFATPLLGGLVGPATKLVLDHIRK
jgi:hypothetical protein